MKIYVFIFSLFSTDVYDGLHLQKNDKIVVKEKKIDLLVTKIPILFGIHSFFSRCSCVCAIGSTSNIDSTKWV